MQDLAAEYKRQYKASRQKMEEIAGNDELKTTVKRQKIDEEHRRIEKVAREYRHKALDALKTEVSENEKSLFGFKEIEFDGLFETEKREKLKDRRDALDRALRYDKKQLSEAYQMFSDAGDSTMTRALAYRAYKTGERDVLDSYLSTDESRQEQYQSLSSAKQRLNPGSGSGIPEIHSSFITPSKPPVRN